MSEADAAQQNTGAPLPTCTFERPRCPHCGSWELKKYRSIRDQGDGSSLSWVRCVACRHRFRMVLE